MDQLINKFEASYMNVETYYSVLRDFQGGQFDSIRKDYKAMCLAQDQMIASLQSKGASIKGWKIVEDSNTFIISPIFDFQIANNIDEHFTPQQVTGFEVELCYLATVPETEQLVDAVVSVSKPRAAIEIMRAKVNPLSHIACDFFFNYGIMVSNDIINGDFQLQNNTAGMTYDYSSTDRVLMDEKEHFLKQGLIECVRRGYQGEYFFMTGSLNGMLDVDHCLGENKIIHFGKDVITFNVAT